jgi:hypothetical protein
MSMVQAMLQCAGISSGIDFDLAATPTVKSWLDQCAACGMQQSLGSGACKGCKVVRYGAWMLGC